MDSNERWRIYNEKRGFDLPTPARPAQQSTEEVDRSWLPKPSSAPADVNWWRNGGAAKEWKQPREWAERSEPAFFSQLQQAEQTMSGLERTKGSHDPQLDKARREVAKYYGQLSNLYDQHIKWRAKNEPFVRY